ncbi:MAG: Cna B-type domain-containing protein, partial [Vagococcus sp.]|uniref:Cna B-type domain-containing protein n=1 Tax=Vagococcus sp. TaxID=1933889 RepID=UPI002FC95EAD
GKNQEEVLDANGKHVTTEAKAKGWTYKFEGLQKYDEDKNLIEYSVKELDVDPNYVSSVQGTNIINKYTNTDTVNIDGHKVWNDYNNKFETRPDEIIVHLLQDGKKKETKTVKKDSDDPEKSYRFEFNELPKYDEHGKPYKYEVIEEVDGSYTWESEIKETKEDHYEVTLTNTYKNTEKIDLSGEKKWDDYENGFKTRPSEVTVELYKTVNGKEEIVESKEVKENPITKKWTYEFTDLDKYDEEGNEISYEIKEITFKDEKNEYTPEFVGNDVINHYVNSETVKFKGEKKWDDYGNKFETRPKEVTIYLLRNNKKIDETKTDESKNWKYDFGKEYPVYDTKGKAYTYRVLEKDVQGYTTTIDKSADSTNIVEDYTIKNTYVNTETTKVEGNKTWDDFDGKVGDRPAKLTVTLFRGLNAETATSTGQTKVLSEKNNWSYVFEDLPVYDADGNKYVYVVKEEKLDEYDQTSSGPYFVNRPKKLDELTFVKGEKSWSDENNILNKRPDKIKVILYQNEKPMIDSDGKIMTQETSVLELWKYEFINLPKYDSQGDEYQYSVKEEEVKDYESVVTGNNIENKYQNNETIDLKGNKTWDDAGNKLESRPESIQVELYQNGGDVPYQVEEVKPDDAGNWNYEFNDLPKYDDVYKEYKYTIKEVNVPHYDSSINGMNIKNSYRNDDTTEFEGKKVWFDKGNLLNKRPDDITVKLFQNGGDDPFKTQKVTPDEQGNWTYKFTDLPKYDDSLNPFKYTVEEDVVEGYESSISEVNGTTITNTLVNNEKTSFKVLKKWEDHNNILDTRPSSIRLNLYRNNGKIPYRTQKVIPDASGNWHYEFKDLPKHDNNLVEYSYSVKEMRVSDYTATVEQTTNQSAVITNEYQNNQTTEIHGDKAWINDADDKLSTRPTSIFVDLYRSDSEDDVYQTQEVVPDEDGDWSYSFKDLPKYDEDLILYTYAVKERNVDGYLGVVEGTDIINTYQNTALTKVVGEKKWADLNNKLEKRPDEISVDLYQNDIKKQTQIVKADKDGNWKYEFNDLPKYEDGTLDEYVYTVKEQKVDGYQTEINGTTITNYYHNDEKTEVTGKKVWLDKDDKLNTRPSVIEVELYQNDGKKPFRTQFVKSNGTNEWTYQFINLPKYDEKLEEYNYTVKERKVSNYSSAIEGTTITNTYKNNQVIGVKGEKTWEDKDNKLNVRPEYIYIDLYQNDSQSPYATEKVEADDKGHWEYEFVNLPKYDDNYDEYTYQVSERKVPHYDTNQTDFNFTNTYRNDDKVEVNGEKKWDDFDNKLKKRPKRIKVDLYQNDSKTPIATKNVKANVDGDWKYSFKDLPKYDENYDEYIYTVKEQDVTNYDSKVEGTTITNTYQNKDKTDISGEKIWRDVDNKLGVRPDSIIVYLHQNGDETPMAEQKVTAGADNKWSYSFKDLPKYDANLDEYHYTVSEKEVPHYDTTIEGTTVTNDYRNDDKTKVTGKKVWNDEDNKLNLRPKSIKVELYQNDSKKPMATQTVKAGKDGNWAYSFNNLPKYDDELNEYVYTVKEQEVSRYESHIEGTTITNTYINDQKTELSGEKKWDDKDNKLKVRPMSIQVELYQNDGKKAFKTQTVTPDKDGHWNYTFKDLPKHDKELNEYVYTVKEKEVAHYDSKIDGNNITNTYRNDDTTEVAGEKKWIDEDNKINSRPTSIQVELYQNDGKEAFKTQKVTPDKNGNWSYVFKDLPKYDDNYDKYTYTVKEQKVPNYDSSVKGTTITNTYENKELIDINGEKQWNDEENKLSKRPESITVDLYRNDSKEPVDTQEVKAGEDGQWKYTFKDLPKYDDKLNEYQYTVKERKVDDYSTVIEGTTIINTYKNVKTTEVTGEKKWNDFDNKLKVRPKVIKVDLYQNNGEKPFRTQEVMPDKNGHWKYSFKALPKYDEKLNEYVYTVKEQPVKGYESKVEGTTITNTYQNKDITSIKGKKLWEDNNNKAGLRPESIMVEVYQNDSKVAFKTEKVTPDASGNWNFTFKDLPKYDKELNEYKYTLKEVAVKNYTSKVDGTTITNTLTKKIDPGKKIKPGTKTGPTSKTGGQRYLPKTGEVQDNPVLTLLLGMSLISFAGVGVFFRRKY